MRFDMTKCMEAFSLALDFAEMDFIKVSMHHARRVAYISLVIADALALPEAERNDLFVYALLHDNGLTLAGLKMGTREMRELFPDHCIEGEKNVSQLPLFLPSADVVQFHHENVDGSGIFGLRGNDIPLLSQIIHIADLIDMHYDLQSLPTSRRDEVVAFCVDHIKSYFSKDVVDAFRKGSNKERFWADLAFYNVSEVLDRISPKISYELSWEDLLPISETFMKIIDSKSRFTFRHSKGLTEKVVRMAQHYELDEEKKIKLRIAANLHDLGKLYIPNTILEKPEKLDTFEFSETRKHTYFTRLALDKIPGFEEISQWASNHHEKLNGKGYPEGLKGDEIDFESRLIGVVDIYQALSEDRPYRKALPQDRVQKIMGTMISGGFIDETITHEVWSVLSN